MRTYPEAVERAFEHFGAGGKATVTLEEYQILAKAKLVKPSMAVWFDDPPPEMVTCILSDAGWEYLQSKQEIAEKMTEKATEKIDAKRAKVLHFFFEIFKLLLAGAIALAVEHFSEIVAFFHSLF